MQGVLCIDIGPLTFGELHHAYKAKIDHDLTQTANLIAAIGNAPHSKPRRRSGYRADDFYRPQIRHKQPPRQVLTPALLRSYKPLFAKRK